MSSNLSVNGSAATFEYSRPFQYPSPVAIFIFVYRIRFQAKKTVSQAKHLSLLASAGMKTYTFFFI
jgi:hypothetical protein